MSQREKAGYQELHVHNVRVEYTRQSLPHFWKYSFRWVLTVIFICLVVATVKIYQDKGVITRTQKHTFNVITVALSLALGINFFVSQGAHAQCNMWRLILDHGTGSLEGHGRNSEPKIFGAQRSWPPREDVDNWS
jgi:hypothetical protein